MHDELRLKLPSWLVESWRRGAGVYRSLEERMELAVSLARSNVEQGSGGPFGAAVFERDSGKLVAVGVNLVLRATASIAHAEVLAITLAQKSAGSHDLAAPGLPPHQLVTSAEPCILCFGAIHWSGLRGVVCGARDEDVRAIGFDEGPKPADWAARLRAAGVEVVQDVGRAAAAAVLADYRRGGGLIYNPGGRPTSRPAPRG